MSKKKEIKKIFENLELESSEAHAEPTPPASAAQETPAPGPEPAEEQGVLPVSGTGQAQPEPAAQEGEEVSPDDLLEDVRKSLLEDDAQEQKEKQPKWWKRFGRSSRKKSAELEAPMEIEEINLPTLSSMQETESEAPVQEEEEEEYLEQIDELIDLLDTEEEPAAEKAVLVEPEPPAEPEKPVDIEELKKQAFQHRPEESEQESLTEVRSIALEGGEEVFVEVDSTPQDPLEERLDAVENALKPYQRYLNFGFAFLGLVMAVTAAFLIYNAYQRSVPQEAPVVEESNLPYPTAVSLPGGWSFNLGRGTLVDGNWNPAGAEWLQGTEVCRWVALPWSRQLEAVIRTLNPDDPIELGMSNNDLLTYNVYSIRQMSPQEMQELDSNTPCLLIVLAEPESDTRWVLTALP